MTEEINISWVYVYTDWHWRNDRLDFDYKFLFFFCINLLLPKQKKEQEDVFFRFDKAKGKERKFFTLLLGCYWLWGFYHFFYFIHNLLFTTVVLNMEINLFFKHNKTEKREENWV